MIRRDASARLKDVPCCIGAVSCGLATSLPWRGTTQMATTIGNLITLDGQFTDWPAADSLMTPTNTVAGYQVYGALLNDATLGKNYVIGINATVTTDPVIAANTFIYLNTDQNTATGFTPFGKVGAQDYGHVSTDSKGVLQPYLSSVPSAGVATQLN